VLHSVDRSFAKLYNDFERPTKRIITTLTGEQEHTPEPLGFENYQNHKGELLEDRGISILCTGDNVQLSLRHPRWGGLRVPAFQQQADEE
jgi:hypothetical protein